MPTNLPSSFASAAAGQNANRGGRGGPGSDWLVFFFQPFLTVRPFLPPNLHHFEDNTPGEKR